MNIIRGFIKSTTHRHPKNLQNNSLSISHFGGNILNAICGPSRSSAKKKKKKKKSTEYIEKARKISKVQPNGGYSRKAMKEYPVIHIPPVIPLTQVNIRFTQIAASIYEARRLRGKQSADRGRNRETRLVHEGARIPSRSSRSSETILDRNSNETPFATRPRRIPPRPDIDSWRAPATRTKDVGIASSYGGLIKSKGDPIAVDDNADAACLSTGGFASRSFDRCTGALSISIPMPDKGRLKNERRRHECHARSLQPLLVTMSDQHELIRERGHAINKLNRLELWFDRVVDTIRFGGRCLVRT
ncbi:hypothetical protein K0M31_004409 [Melipona bicolor]|uniref:Uncharacterized protein n=1 Tax=Melipona bicolor TaxID=60889 RepID=A0AA40KNG5_9HYME|nr:hypothetical protein K0M31_004409 [Melipona bicolor]